MSEGIVTLPDSLVHGLTKREYFAAMALQGLLAGDTIQHLSYQSDARTAVEYADYLIQALNRAK